VERLQDKFFRVLDERAAKAKLDVVTVSSASNVGALHLQPTDSFETALSVDFNFQSGDKPCNLKCGEPIFGGRTNPRFVLLRADELDYAIDAIVMAADR
jgi:hypothetical protein